MPIFQRCKLYVVLAAFLLCSTDARENVVEISYSQKLNSSLNFQNNLNGHVKNKARNTFLPRKSFYEIENVLVENNLNQEVIDKTLTALNCAKKQRLQYNSIVTIIDYSMPSNKKRLWIFDLSTNKLLFHTYVSHGIKNGILFSNYFSNKNHSKASSMGIYITENIYRGRHGWSLKLAGLDPTFNDNAYSRAIVMHGAWYLDENFIRKYGRPGRSWGCPAVASELAGPILNTIKNKSLLVAYYPNQEWLTRSKFLNCNQNSRQLSSKKLEVSSIINLTPFNDPPEQILFADLNNNNRREENEPILAMQADEYYRYLHKEIPLKRMLRLQINRMEYIALNDMELKTLKEKNNNYQVNNNNQNTTHIYFVVPNVHVERGYYITKMQTMNLGKFTEVNCPVANLIPSELNATCNLSIRNKSKIYLRTSSQFIRWLGL